jgi:hypothetical protein
MLQDQLPVGAAEVAGQRDRQAATLRKKLAKIETAQKGLITQIEQLGDDTAPANAPCATASPSSTASATPSTPLSPPS